MTATAPVVSKNFQPGEGPSRALLHYCENRWLVCSSNTDHWNMRNGKGIKGEENRGKNLPDADLVVLGLEVLVCARGVIVE